MRITRSAAAVLILLSSTTLADQFVLDSSDSDPSVTENIILPYAFSTEALATGFGAVYARSGGNQPQQSAYATAYYTTNDSYALFAGLSRRQIWSDRLFFSPVVGLTWNQDQRFYGELLYRASEGGSGSNESSADDFVSGEGTNSFVDLVFRYVLPIGAGKDEPLRTYRTTDGFLTEGTTRSGRWNPFRGGHTVFEFKPFYQRRSIEVTDENADQFPPIVGVGIGETAERKTAGIALSLEYDNRDLAVNPSRGSFTWAKIERDWGWLASTDEWTALQGSFAKYINLGTSGLFRQQVLALNAWTAYTPTWKVEQVAPGIVFIRDRPPSNLGAALGGPLRMRAYPLGRFNDRAAVYYSAELRLIPEWNPLARWPIIRKTPWRWWQWVAFGELGRVAPEWKISTLHEDMKWSAGVGVRAMISGSVTRFDVAFSEESTQGMVYIAQPF